MRPMLHAASGFIRMFARMAFGLALALSLLVVFPAATPVAGAAGPEPPVWTILSVVAPKDFAWLDDRSARVDDAGRVHVAYGGDHLYYAWKDQAWHYEVVDAATRTGAYASLALGPGGDVHISYYDARFGDLKHAQRSGGSWTVEVVDNAGDVGKDSSIAVDSAGRPHIAYLDATHGRLKYASSTGSGWQLATAGTAHGGISLALDAAGNPHVAYGDGVRGLSYAVREGAGWKVDKVDDAGFGSPSLALDASGNPHIGYTDPGSGIGLNYAGWTGSGWAIAVIEKSQEATSAVSLALSDSGAPLISYDHDGRLRFARRANGAWQTEDVDAGGSNNSLAIGPGGVAHVLHCIPMPGMTGCAELRHARSGPGSWQLERVDTAAFAGQTSQVAVDAGGRPHVVYSLTPQGGLFHARWNGSSWDTEQIAAGPASVHGVALALDAAGAPHVAYYAAGGIHYARRTAAGWQTQDVDPLGVDPLYLALDRDAAPHLTFQTLGGPALRYARQNGNGWEVQVVDATGVAGGLAIDATDRPNIIYSRCNPANSPCATIDYARWDGQAWQLAQVSTGAGAPIAFALDAAGHRHAGYYGTDQSLHYAFWNGTAWSLEPVDPAHGAGAEASLAVDGSGVPHFAYLGPTVAQGVSDLRYAFRPAGAWITATVDSGIDISAYVSLAVAASGARYLTYTDNTNGDLKLAIGHPADAPATVCARGPDYWRQRSEFGPLPYAPAWGMLPAGAYTAFMDGAAYRDVLAAPAAGSAYYYLAHFYLAFQLNTLSGVPFDAASRAAYDEAAALLAAHPAARESDLVRAARTLRGAMVAARLSSLCTGALEESLLDARSIDHLPVIQR